MSSDNQIVSVPYIEGANLRLHEEDVEQSNIWAGEATGEGALKEDVELQFFFEQLKDAHCKTYIDIGANSGSFSFLPLLVPDAHCLAIEPNPKLAKLLTINAKLNGIEKKVDVLDAALSAEPGTATIKIPKDSKLSGLACLAEPTRFEEWDEVEVQMTTLDILMEKLNDLRVELIKIDTEGSELLILAGGEKYLRKHKPKILLEYSALNAQQFNYKREAIFELLVEFGYNNFKILGRDLFTWFE